MKQKVLIIMGSDSDLPVMEETEKILKAFGISFETTIASAHRSPERAVRLAKGAEKKGFEVIIAGAGRSSAPCRSYCSAYNTSCDRRPH